MDEPPLFYKNLDDLLPPNPTPGKSVNRVFNTHKIASGQTTVTNRRWKPTHWWQFGLMGGVVLSYATAIKFVRAIRGGASPDAGWTDIAGFAAAIFGMGFLCGVIVWAGSGLYR